MPALNDFSDSTPVAPSDLQNVKWQSQATPTPLLITNIAAGGLGYVVTTGLAHGLSSGDLAFVQGGGAQVATGTWVVDVTTSTIFSIVGNVVGANLFRAGPGCVVIPFCKSSAYLPAFVGGSGGSPPSGGLGGAVPAPAPGDAPTKFLCADGTWQVPSSSGAAVPLTREINTTLPLTGGGDLAADLTLGINVFTGDGGSPPTGGTEGAVPAPAPGDAAAGKFLSADGSWEVPGGDVPPTREIATTLPLTGGGDLSSDLDLGINNFTGVAGSPPIAGASGAVPAPGTGDVGKFLSSDGSWAPTGDVPLSREIATTLPLTGGGPLSGDLDLAINNFTGVSGSPPVAGLAGAVPAPATGDVGKFLSSGGGWQPTGDVPLSREIATTLPLTGGGPLSGDLDLDINDFTGDSGSPPTGGVRGTVPAPSPGDAAAGKFLSAAGGWSVPGYPTLPNFADNETPSGLMNASNQSYALANAPSPAGSLVLVYDGVVQLQGTDYTLIGNAIAYANAKPDSSIGEWHKAWYRH